MRNFIIALVLSVVSVASYAVEKNANQPLVSVEFVGFKNNQPIYKLSIKNPENAKLTVVVRDIDGIILHEEVVEGTTITKNFRFTKEEVKDNDIMIEVTRYADPLTSRIRLDKKPLAQK